MYQQILKENPNESSLIKPSFQLLAIYITEPLVTVLSSCDKNILKKCDLT